MKLNQTYINITGNNDEINYVSNGTIKAVTTTIDMLPEKFNIGYNNVNAFNTLCNNESVRFDPLLHTAFRCGMYGWDLPIAYYKLRTGAAYYISTPLSRLSRKFLNDDKLEYEGITMMGHNPLGLNTYPDHLIHFAPDMDLGIGKTCWLETELDRIVERIEQNNSHDVIVIDSLANLSDTKSGKRLYHNVPEIEDLLYSSTTDGKVRKIKTDSYYGRCIHDIPQRNPTIHHVPYITLHPNMSLSDSSSFKDGDNIVIVNDDHEDTKIKNKPWKAKTNSISGKIKNRRRKGR